MPRRSRNKSKRLKAKKHGHGINSDEEQSNGAALDAKDDSKDDSGDEDFDIPDAGEAVSENAQGQDEMASNASEEGDAEAGGEAEGEGLAAHSKSSPKRTGRAGRLALRSKAKAASSKAAASKQATNAKASSPPNYHEIRSYPADVKKTRVYAGPLKKWDRFRALVDLMYGPDLNDIAVINELRAYWADVSVLPLKTNEEGGVVPSPWLPDRFEATQAERLRGWYEKYRKDIASFGQPGAYIIPPEHGRKLLPQAAGELVSFIGPAGCPQEARFCQGEPRLLDASGRVTDGGREELDGEAAGWMLDVGGIVLSMGWAPLSRFDDQVLALAVIPHADQAYYQTEDERPSENSMKTGCIQLWDLPFDRDGSGKGTIPRASKTLLPRLARTLCFDWGRPKRMQWCPIPLLVEDTVGLLAVLTGDGRVRVLEVPRDKPRERVAESDTDTAGSPIYHWIEKPMATLDLTDEYNIKVTCFTWVNTNRIVLGHSDGSITLWSLHPRVMLQRHAVHSNYILDVCSGYPSYPYLVSSSPLGGTAKLVDLSRPSGEVTFNANPLIGFQPGLTHWFDHMRGFASAYPISNPNNASLGFAHVKFFNHSRIFFTGPAACVCLSLSPVHPFALVGCADGSLWACNLIRKVLLDRGELLYKMRIFQHEFRPVSSGGGGGGASASAVRGAVRILQGFAPERNENPKAEHFRRIHKMAANAKGSSKSKDSKKESGRRGGAKGVSTEVGEAEDQGQAEGVSGGEEDDTDDDIYEDTENEGADTDGDGDVDGDGARTERPRYHDPKKSVVYEPLTRVTSVAWNPNIEFGWWAAAAMASGLVRIMDLGVEVGSPS